MAYHHGGRLSPKSGRQPATGDRQPVNGGRQPLTICRQPTTTQSVGGHLTLTVGKLAIYIILQLLHIIIQLIHVILCCLTPLCVSKLFTAFFVIFLQSKFFLEDLEKCEASHFGCPAPGLRDRRWLAGPLALVMCDRGATLSTMSILQYNTSVGGMV